MTAPTPRSRITADVIEGETLRVGIVGGGLMGAAHARAARAAGAVIVGVTSSTADSTRRAQQQLRIPRAYDALEAMLADDTIDLVHICSPNDVHADHAAAVIAAGKHVICEKPLAVNAHDAAKLQVAAHAAGLVATVPFVYRFHPMAREARDRVRSLESTYSVHGAYLQDWLALETDDNWRTDPIRGGASRAFADTGSHLVDLLEFVTGDRIHRLQAVTSTVHPQRGGHTVENEDVCAVLVDMDSGAIGTLQVSQVSPGHKNALSVEISGTGTTVRFEQENPETLWLGSRHTTQMLPRDPQLLGPEARRLSIVPAGHPMGYTDAFAAFVADTYAAVTGHAPDGLPTFADGARAATITGAVLQSAATGTWVNLGD